MDDHPEVSKMIQIEQELKQEEDGTSKTAELFQESNNGFEAFLV
jgi:hypothetical protein